MSKKTKRKSHQRTAGRSKRRASGTGGSAGGRGQWLVSNASGAAAVAADVEADVVALRAPARAQQSPPGGERGAHVEARSGEVALSPAPDPIPLTEPRELSEPVAARGCAAASEEMEPQGLVATYELPRDRDRSLAVAFVGARVGSEGSEHLGDSFGRVVSLNQLPATGRATVSVRVSGINKGTWRVVGKPVGDDDAASRQTVTTTTRLAPLAVGPGVRIAAWPILVGVGAIAALVAQALLFARVDSRWWAATLLSVLGCLVGVLGAKVWFLVLHRERHRSLRTAGACIQGFIVAAVGTVIVGALAVGLPVGELLDVTAPGLFLGLAIGRPGCFLSGCCAGRATSSRWGVWSSDRQLGVRRYPVQLIEAAGALMLAAISLVLVLTVPAHWPGSLFVANLIVYVLLRQLLFPLRSDPHTARGRTWTTLAGLALLTVDLVAVTA
ncbi:phosphatidylglycerol:prolipoprotein diacylglycerol transferase [Williamsia limnetica]|uniref:Phosphatidylglycerol:prolipoprotein diacylglycerol transferase n=1 Tax=Williamsia limnetica TaxID=882452 RepID=A0A318R879_WILLI|nr:phosphatidylglycerol:prolipoprotein diacylglycerol transferase [Williamsia limnetica]